MGINSISESNEIPNLSLEQALEIAKKIINDNSGAHDFKTMNMMFRGLSEEELSEEYGESGNTKKEVLDGYRNIYESNKMLLDTIEKLISGEANLTEENKEEVLSKILKNLDRELTIFTDNFNRSKKSGSNIDNISAKINELKAVKEKITEFFQSNKEPIIKKISTDELLEGEKQVQSDIQQAEELSSAIKNGTYEELKEYDETKHPKYEVFQKWINGDSEQRDWYEENKDNIKLVEGGIYILGNIYLLEDEINTNGKKTFIYDEIIDYLNESGKEIANIVDIYDFLPENKFSKLNFLINVLGLKGELVESPNPSYKHIRYINKEQPQIDEDYVHMSELEIQYGIMNIVGGSKDWNSFNLRCTQKIS